MIPLTFLPVSPGYHRDGGEGSVLKSLEGGKLGKSPGRLDGDHSQSQDSGCRSGQRDVLDMVAEGFAEGLETGRKAGQIS